MKVGKQEALDTDSNYPVMLLGLSEFGVRQGGVGGGFLHRVWTLFRKVKVSFAN